MVLFWYFTYKTLKISTDPSNPLSMHTKDYLFFLYKGNTILPPFESYLRIFLGIYFKGKPI